VTTVWIVKQDGHVLGVFTSREFAEVTAGRYPGSEVEERSFNRITEVPPAEPKRRKKPAAETAERDHDDAETAAE
jgi:hypothetical protein